MQGLGAYISPSGLSSEQAEARLKQFGFNEPARAKRRSALVSLLILFLNPLAIILLLAGGISGFLGQTIDAAIICSIVILGTLINFLQTWRSQRAADDLRQQVLPTATVRRDGAWREVAQRYIVPGDLVRLSAGDLVPADAMLLFDKSLHVQQGALTGESFPVDKGAIPDAPPSRDPNAQHMVFLGTSVVSGSAEAVVISTGIQTVFGDIAQRLAVKPEETEFERGLRRFGSMILQTVLFLVLFLLVVSIAAHRNPLQSLLFAVSLAVGLTPEFLPMITSVTLARGAVNMARKRVIVKHLASIQNLGSIDVLCSDKTGTLTQGTMKVDRALDAAGNESEHVLLLAQLNSRYDTGIRSPLDAAILDRQCTLPDDYRKIDEIPFDFERRRVSVVLERTGSRVLIAKGSPEGVLACCSALESGNTSGELDADVRNACLKQFQELSRQGLRILAVAHKVVTFKSSYAVDDEDGMCFAGLVTFVDPPLSDVAEILAKLRHDGIQLKIVTGDNELVTRYVCERVGIGGESILLGDELESMTDPALGHVAETTNVFARVSPAQKNRIILALKHRGHVVAFMGDGINDAPSLHAADVGISVSTAVDVARDAAEIILLEPGLDVLHAGVLEGRKAFGNVMKYLLMGTSSNFGNVFSMAAASMLLPFLPMLPTQILLNNFLYDLAQITIPTDHVDADRIAGPQRWDISVVRKFMLIVGPVSSLYDFLTFYVLLHFFRAGESLFHTGWFVESLATQTLVLLVIRTSGNPFRSRPSLPLVATILLSIVVGLLLPFIPAANALGFTPLPLSYFAFLGAATLTYLWLVHFVRGLVIEPTTTSIVAAR
ncbi:MAG TPA: magnesium-translocating P-type ATPase [Bryobacteraceae bacterium]|nr:magnesium-translocating P-type ATPase [Bryobacteraceae bacterium]